MPISLLSLGIDEAAEVLGRDIDLLVGCAKWLYHVESFGYSRNDVCLVNGKYVSAWPIEYFQWLMAGDYCLAIDRPAMMDEGCDCPNCPDDCKCECHKLLPE